jgi:hypothetical protein
MFPMPKPNKRNQRKQPRRRRMRQGSLTYVNTTSQVTRQLFPRRILSWLTTTFGGYLPASTAASGNFSVNATSIYEPFNQVVDNVNTSGKFTSSTTFTILANPIGYGEASVVYDFYRVHKARLKVTLIPNASGDTSMLTVYPSAIGVAGTNLLQASQQPYSRWKLVNQGAPNSANSITAQHTSWDVLGLRKRQFIDLQATAMGVAPSANQSWFFNVEWACNDNAVNSNAIYIIVEIEQFTELSQPAFLTT